VANTLAYYDTATITAIKKFIVQAPGSIYYKTFKAAIKARVFVAVSHFHLSLIFEGKAPSGAPLR
jgi:hypothetical protein